MQYLNCQVSNGVMTRLFEYSSKQGARGLCFWFCAYPEFIDMSLQKMFMIMKAKKFKYLLYNFLLN